MSTPFPTRLKRTLLVAITVILVLWVLYLARSDLIPFIIGLFLAYIISPLVGWIEGLLPKWGPLPRANRIISVLLVYLVVAGIIAIIAILFLPGFIKSIQDFIAHVPAYVTTARRILEEWTARYQSILPKEISDQLNSTIEGIVPSIIGNAQRLVPQAISTVFQTFSFFLGLFALPIWLFFVLRDRDKLMESFYSLLPSDAGQMARDIVGIIDRVLGSYLRARLMMALVVGTLTSIGLLILDIRFAIVLGAVAAFTELIPIIGPYLGAIPAIIVGLATSPEKVLWIIILFLAVQIIENNLLDPIIQGEMLQVHPAIIIVTLVIALAVVGLWGMLVAVLVVALGREIFKYLYSRWSESEEQASSKEDTSEGNTLDSRQ